MSKQKLQLEDLKERNKTLLEENRTTIDKLKFLEEKLSSTKMTTQNLKNQIRDKDGELLRLRDSSSQVETMKTDNINLMKRIDEQNKKIKALKEDAEYFF